MKTSGPRAGPRTPTVAALCGLLVIAVLVHGCGGTPAASGSCTPGSEETVSGVVLSVVGTTPTAISAFTLRSDAGDTLTFTVGTLDLADGAFPAGHLREHQATAAPVRVQFRSACDARVAVRLTDG